MRIQLLVGIFLLFTASVYVQKGDSVFAKSDQVLSFSNRFFNRMQRKSADLNTVLHRQKQLAGFLGTPADYGTQAGTEGLQTRTQVQQLILGESSGIAELQSNLESVRQQLDQFQGKLSSADADSGNMNMPDFQPNQQKTKSLLKRIEIGTNLQTERANYFFPGTTDIGLSIDHKLPGSNIIGIGESHEISWSQNISHIRSSSERASTRSFLDIKLKKSFYASGGYELNHRKAFTSFSQISSVNDWTRSGPIGISKIVSLGGKA
jgi:hypothetical protein